MSAVETPQETVKTPYKRSSAEQAFHAALLAHAPDLAKTVVEQHAFALEAMKRRWRWDACWIAEKVAVEVHGATWSGGRHNRGSGIAADAEKLCAGTELGWAVLVYTSSQIKADPQGVIAQVERVIGARRAR